MQATHEALAEEMARNPAIFVLGEGIGKRGGNFKTTAGLYDLYGPERLCDTPICERGFVGLACGAAMTGTRPVVDFMFADFVLDCGRRDPQPDRQDAVHVERPAPDAGPAARLHRHRPLGGDAPFGQLLSAVCSLPRPARGRALDAGRRQGTAAAGPALRRSGAVPGAPRTARRQGAGAGRRLRDRVRPGRRGARRPGRDRGRPGPDGAADARSRASGWPARASPWR